MRAHLARFNYWQVTPGGKTTAGIDEPLVWQEEFYEDLHRHPDIWPDEARTAGKIVRKLEDIGVDEVLQIGGGVAAIIRYGEGRKVLYRADMDALHGTEQTGLEYASEETGKMHACGHDAHVAWGLGAAALLAQYRSEWSGTYIGPAVLASAIVLRLQGIVSRETAPDDFGVVTVGQMDVGTAPNAISDRAEIVLNIRAYDLGVRDTILAAVHRNVRGECEASGPPEEPVFETLSSFPLTVNDAGTTEVVDIAFREAFGGERVQELAPVPASEDFSLIPAAFGVSYTYGARVDFFRVLPLWAITAPSSRRRSSRSSAPVRGLSSSLHRRISRSPTTGLLTSHKVAVMA